MLKLLKVGAFCNEVLAPTISPHSENAIGASACAPDPALVPAPPAVVAIGVGGALLAVAAAVGAGEPLLAAALGTVGTHAPIVRQVVPSRLACPVMPASLRTTRRVMVRLLVSRTS